MIKLLECFKEICSFFSSLFLCDVLEAAFALVLNIASWCFISFKDDDSDSEWSCDDGPLPEKIMSITGKQTQPQLSSEEEDDEMFVPSSRNSKKVSRRFIGIPYTTIFSTSWLMILLCFFDLASFYFINTPILLQSGGRLNDGDDNIIALQ